MFYQCQHFALIVGALVTLKAFGVASEAAPPAKGALQSSRFRGPASHHAQVARLLHNMDIKAKPTTHLVAESGQQPASRATQHMPPPPAVGVAPGTAPSPFVVLNKEAANGVRSNNAETEALAHGISEKLNQLEQLAQSIVQDDAQYAEQRRLDLQHDVKVAADVTQQYEGENNKLANYIKSLRQDNVNLEQRAIKLRTANAKIVRELYGMQSNVRDVMTNFSAVAQQERAKDDVKNAIALVKDVQGDMPGEELMKAIAESSVLPQAVAAEPERAVTPQPVIVEPEQTPMASQPVFGEPKAHQLVVAGPEHKAALQPVVVEPDRAAAYGISQPAHIDDLVSKVRSQVGQENDDTQEYPTAVMDNSGNYDLQYGGMSELQMSQTGRQGTEESDSHMATSQGGVQVEDGSTANHKNSDAADSWDEEWDDDQQNNLPMSFLATSRRNFHTRFHRAQTDPAILRAKALRAELGIANQRQSPAQRLLTNLHGLFQIAGRLDRFEERKEDQSETATAEALAPYAARHQQLTAERERLNKVKGSLLQVNHRLTELVKRLQDVHSRLKTQLRGVRESLTRIDSLTDV